MHLEIKQICVPTDFSECGDHAVQHGAAMARKFDAELHIVHVIQDVGEKLKHPDFTSQGTSVTEFLKALEKGATEYLARLAAEKAWKGLKVNQLYLHGAPAEQICRYALDQEIDLLVLGTHGRSGLKHLLLGSVAERVLRTSPCPVLTVRYPLVRNLLRGEGMSKLPGVE